MKNFSKFELKSILFILIILFFLTGINLSISLRKGRDQTRKDDLFVLTRAVYLFEQRYGHYPLSSAEGKIIGCFNDEPIIDSDSGFVINAEICEWGESSFVDLPLLPRDPDAQKNASYLYKSDGSDFSLYIALEGKKEVEYTPKIEALNLQCGIRICNYRRGNE